MQMEVNFFGLMWVTKKALEVMREQGTGGKIQQITSIGGQTGVPTFSKQLSSNQQIWADMVMNKALTVLRNGRSR